MENEIKPMTKKELIKRIEEYKPKYIYQRYNGEIRQFEVVDNNYLVETKTGMSIDFRSHLMLGKVSENLKVLIECGDYVNGYCVAEIEKDKNGNITDICYEEEMEMQLYSVGDIESIVTKEHFEAISYKVERK